MFCVHCGSKIEDGCNFCPNCGQKAQAPYSVSTVTNDTIDNKYVWALATVPILTSWILAEILGASILVTIVTIALNVAFLSLDIKVLKNAGKDAESWLWLGIVLVPLYLFMRASKTDKNYIYGIVWCGMFVLDLII